jgi:hypothetical protein
LRIHFLACPDAHQIGVDQTQPSAFRRVADSCVLGQRLANPDILAIVCADEQYEIVSCGIVRVEEVRDYAQETEAPRKEDELIFLAKLFEDVLLEFL